MNNLDKKKKAKRYTWDAKLFIFLCVSVPVVQWLIFYVYVHIDAFFLGFMNKNGEFTIDNFTRLFQEFTLETSEIRLALRNTLLTFSITVISYIPHVLVSYFLYKKIPGHKFYRIVFFLPSIIFSVAISMAFTRMLDTNGFVAQTVQKWMDLDYTPELLADSRFANTVVLAEMVWLAFPGELILWGGTFARIPEDLLESAQLDGVTWWQEFTKIIVPLVWPTVALQMILLSCGIFGASANVFLLTHGKFGTINLSTWMYLQLLDNSGSNYTSNVYNYMSAVGMVMTVIAVSLSIVVRKITDKMNSEVDY